MSSYQSNEGSSPTPQGFKIWLYLLTALVSAATVVVGGVVLSTAYSSLLLHRQVEARQAAHQESLRQWHTLDRAEAFAVEGDYLTCSNLLSEVEPNPVYYERTGQLLDVCRCPLGELQLSQADALANEGQFRDAIQIALAVDPGPKYAAAQQRARSWSQQMVAIARGRYAASTVQIDSVVAQLLAIPEGSPGYESEIKPLIAHWQKEWADNAYYTRAARSALETNNLLRASEFTREITSHLAWADERRQLLLDIEQKSQTYDQQAYEAEQYLRENQLELAAQTAKALPNTEPWLSRKQYVLSSVRDTRYRSGFLPIFLTATSTLFVTLLLVPACRPAYRQR